MSMMMTVIIMMIKWTAPEAANYSRYHNDNYDDEYDYDDDEDDDDHHDHDDDYDHDDDQVDSTRGR